MPRYYDDRHFSTLRDALTNCYSVDKLREIARCMNLRKTPSRKQDLVEELVTQSQSGWIFELFSKTDKSALAEAAHNSLGMLQLDRFIAKYGTSPYTKSHDGYRYGSSVLDLFLIDGRIPDDIVERLKATFPKPSEDSVRADEKLAGTITLEEKSGYDSTRTYTADITEKLTEHCAAENLKSILLFIEGGKIRVSAKTRRPSSAAIGLISGQLADGDWYCDDCYGGIQSYAWPLIVQAAGMVSLSGTLLSLSSKGKKIVHGTMDAVEGLRAAWNAWNKKALIDEFSRVETIKGQQSRGRVMAAARERRDVIIDALADCPVMQWIDIDEFGRHMRAVGHYFHVAHDPWKLYFCEPHYGSLGYSGHGGWDILQKRYLQVFFMEYAATLGLLDIAYTTPEEAPCDFFGLWGTDEFEYLSRYDGLRFFRINRLGAYMLGMASSYIPVHEPPPAGPALEVLPNFECIATIRSAMKKSDVLYIEKIADTISDMHWKLNRKKIARALENGETGDTILDFLTAKSSHELPQTVTALITETTSRIIDFIYEGKACLLACDDAHYIRLVQSDSQLKKTCLIAGENHIVLLNGKEERFFKRMNDLGYVVPAMKKII